MDNALLASFFASFSSEQSAFADAGHGRNLLVGMVFQELQGVVDLCRLELLRAAFTIMLFLLTLQKLAPGFDRAAWWNSIISKALMVGTVEHLIVTGGFIRLTRKLKDENTPERYMNGCRG